MAEVSLQDIPALLGSLEQLKVTLWTRLLTTPLAIRSREAPEVKDKLLTIPQLAELLAIRRISICPRYPRALRSKGNQSCRERRRARVWTC